jgi:hypothetical protein
LLLAAECIDGVFDSVFGRAGAAVFFPLADEATAALPLREPSGATKVKAVVSFSRRGGANPRARFIVAKRTFENFEQAIIEQNAERLFSL